MRRQIRTKAYCSVKLFVKLPRSFTGVRCNFEEAIQVPSEFFKRSDTFFLLLLTWIPWVRSCWDFAGCGLDFYCFRNFWRRFLRSLLAVGSTPDCSSLAWPMPDSVVSSCPRWCLYCSAYCSRLLDHRHLPLLRHWNKKKTKFLIIYILQHTFFLTYLFYYLFIVLSLSSLTNDI